MNKADLKMIGDEFERVLEPVHEELESINKKFDQVNKKFDQVNKKFDQVNKKLEIIEQKQDAQTGDIINLQNQVGVIVDKVTAIDEKLKDHINEERKERDEIREHIGMPPLIR